MAAKSKFTDLLLIMVIPMLKAVGKEQLKDILSNIQEHNTKEIYDSTLKSLHSNFTLLKDVARKSKTKIDDTIIDLVLEAVEESASEDNVQL